MKLAILASATEASLQSEQAEKTRLARLYNDLEQLGSTIDMALNLLGRHDYLFVVDIPDEISEAFKVAATMIQSGGMRTETFVGIPVDEYADIASRRHDDTSL